MAQPTSPAAAQDDRAAPLGPYEAPRIAAAQRRFWLILDAMIVALVIVASVGGWAYFHVRGAMRELRTAGLASLLEVEVRGALTWIEEKKRDAERWASIPAVRLQGAALVAAARRAQPCAEAPQRALSEEIAPFATIEEITVFDLIARDGRIVSSPFPAHCGRIVSEAFRQRLAAVFEGRTVFVAPVEESERLGGPHAHGGSGARFTWIEAPVRAPDGAVVAALGFGRRPEERFERLLALSVEGTSRDAYAFDERGRFLTPPRFPPQPWRARSAATQPGRPDALTALAAAAVAHGDGPSGVLLEPYVSYRGARVIGAWRWLEEGRMAVAVELDAAEAYGPLEYLQVAFGVLFALVLVSMTAAAGTSLWAARMGLREARRIGQYRLEREIGEGGMSHIYLAHHALLRRAAAVKVLKPHLATDEAVARFQREAQMCSQLAHPNTVEIYDYGTTRDGRWYYAMEYLRGASLHELVVRHGPMPAARIVHMLRQACGSLGEAHDRGWVHRDVKPSNLMLCSRAGQHDVVKLLDFGIVKDTRNPHTRDITQYSRVLGTPLFMAPERLRNPADADARSDIYALGAVAWFALAGRAAFEGETDHDIVYRVLNEPAPSLSPRGATEVERELEALVARCLEKDRELRPADVGEVLGALEAIAARLPWTEAQARAWWEAHAAGG